MLRTIRGTKIFQNSGIRGKEKKNILTKAKEESEDPLYKHKRKYQEKKLKKQYSYNSRLEINKTG
jgi:hypothetical protein